MFILNNGIDSFFTVLSSHTIQLRKEEKRKGKEKKGKQETRGETKRKMQ